MKLTIVIAMIFTLNSNAQSTCPQFHGEWLGVCRGKTVTIKIQQTDCDKFLFNEVYEAGVSPKYYTLDQPSFYKFTPPNGDVIRVSRVAFLSPSGDQLILLQNEIFESYNSSISPWEVVGNWKFVVDRDGNLTYRHFRSVLKLETADQKETCGPLKPK